MTARNFQIGDIIENDWAGDINPTKRMIYIGRGKYLLHDGRVTGFDNPPFGQKDPLKKVGHAFVEGWRTMLASREGDPS